VAPAGAIASRFGACRLDKGAQHEKRCVFISFHAHAGPVRKPTQGSMELLLLVVV
jgi:hypothetical protein